MDENNSLNKKIKDMEEEISDRFITEQSLTRISIDLINELNLYKKKCEILTNKLNNIKQISNSCEEIERVDEKMRLLEAH